MSKNTLTEAFDIKVNNNKISTLTDYEIFPNKVLLDNLRNTIIQNIIDNKIPKDKLLKEYIDEVIDDTLEGYDISNLARTHIYNLIENEINGYGPITELLEDENITEIMVNGPDDVYIELNGNVIKDESVSFINENHILRTIQRMVQPLGRTIDVSNPMVDSRLPSGERINAIIPPLSLKGPILTIRKFKKDLSSIEDFLRNGTLTPYMARFLQACVEARLNIIISGGTGAGKTTLLNILSSFINNSERIITIEDAAELRLHQSHVISLETRTSNYKTQNEVTIRDLVRNSLRMRPDRIIVGEVRGLEAFDMLQAMNTGHDGSLTTLHSNSNIDALNRLEAMVLMAGMDLPVNAIREYIVGAIDIVVHIDRLSDGRRKVTSIAEIAGIKDGIIQLKEIFAFKQKGLTKNGEVDGEFILYKRTPGVFGKIKAHGIDNIDDIFVR